MRPGTYECHGTLVVEDGESVEAAVQRGLASGLVTYRPHPSWMPSDEVRLWWALGGHQAVSDRGSY